MAEFDQALLDAVIARARDVHGMYGLGYSSGYREAALQAARIAAERQATPTPSDDAEHTIPSWATHVTVSIGAHYHEWIDKRTRRKTWKWQRSCWGEGPTLQEAIADMNRKSCVTDESWAKKLELNPHIKAEVGQVNDD